jgi:2-amino-4-hydroxy-6-hydroxymethyldihydropteridine diphosphokinase
MNTELAFIGLGSNQGNRGERLAVAVKLIQSALGDIIKQSSVYETKPWGNTSQPDFLNQVISVHTTLAPQACMQQLAAIENKLGRVRTEKWGPRIIDLDLLYYNQLVLHLAELQLPHSGIAQRKFVLIPLAEIAPDFIHPRLHKNHLQLLAECTDDLEVKLAYKLDTST